ncbi:hypothetical protein DICPUDRAFT_99663 [Dictyostelium purpureum]|uniref:Autophagy protein ATG17-like domain-containing protein n=1 Tax=Dictyostelium purpureum TaxID=5786 RepID=F1A1C4_DICPU|nr:uncharacterized protein DICPUDRAFT_99663 [Dictyostelium purpureum]EGC30001.1 hypothetical protein DICPUDRAFT_99663 [Dictyostelium purpureum]|eukprot:XP_003293467.1 hypothetical protein DICPUDRAFT_99663 [Dictyostelium purpureum]
MKNGNCQIINFDIYSNFPTLMDFSNKSLDLCKTYSNQADQLLKQSKQSLKKYNNSLSKLHLTIKETNKQINIIKESIKSFNEKNNTFLNECTTLINFKQQIFETIDFKLEILKKKVLDKGLVFKNKQQNDNNLNTLYDFIDTESLELIRNQFLQEVNGLNDLYERINQIQETLNNDNNDLEIQFLELQNEFNKEIQDNSNKNNNDHIISQHNLYTTINNTLINIASQCDFITFFKPPPPPQQQQQQQQQQDFNKDINNRKEQIQLYLANAAENLLLLSKNAKDFDEKFKRINHLYSLAFILYDKLSGTVSNDFGNSWETFEKLCSIFEQRYSAANYFLGELSSLNKWYELFDNSYDNLLEEVKRRQREFLRQKTIAEQFELELKEQFNLELQNRINFYDQYGKFLPVSLFSTISDPPIQFQIKQIEETDIFPQQQQQIEQKEKEKE